LWVGCETALYSAAMGASEVTLLEALTSIAGDCEPITRRDLLFRMEEERIDVRTGIRLREITYSEVIFDDADRLEKLPAELGFPVYVVGDASTPRGIYEAINEGWLAAVKLSQGTEGG